jgi:hypothetical protein
MPKIATIDAFKPSIVSFYLTVKPLKNLCCADGKILLPTQKQPSKLISKLLKKKNFKIIYEQTIQLYNLLHSELIKIEHMLII